MIMCEVHVRPDESILVRWFKWNKDMGMWNPGLVIELNQDNYPWAWLGYWWKATGKKGCKLWDGSYFCREIKEVKI